MLLLVMLLATAAAAAKHLFKEVELCADSAQQSEQEREIAESMHSELGIVKGSQRSVQNGAKNEAIITVLTGSKRAKTTRMLAGETRTVTKPLTQATSWPNSPWRIIPGSPALIAYHRLSQHRNFAATTFFWGAQSSQAICAHANISRARRIQMTMRLTQLQRPLQAAALHGGYRPGLTGFSLPIRPAVVPSILPAAADAIRKVEGRRYASVKSQGAYRIPNKKTIAKKLGAKRSGGALYEAKLSFSDDKQVLTFCTIQTNS